MSMFDKKYRTILVDPPWPQAMAGRRLHPKRRTRPDSLPYSTMSLEEIAALPVSQIADRECHLWLWTTNQHLPSGFRMLESWGFKYLAPIHWIKPTGMGNYFIHLTQTCLFAYRGGCKFPLGRYKPNIFHAPVPRRHSRKPDSFYDLIESVSPAPRIELFAREPVWAGWDSWGDEVINPVSVFSKGPA